MSEIKNLSQLRKAINNGETFVIKRHYVRPEFSGQKRKPTMVQTNGFYSIAPDDPNCLINKWNNGKGSWIQYGRASDWKFEDGLCKQYCYGKIVWEIKFE